MTKFKTIITAAIAALALTTASLAIPGQAFAGGHGHGGHGGHGHHGFGGGHFGHGLFWGVVITTIIAISSLITAAGNGAPTARSTSATAIIDARRRKGNSPGSKSSGEFF
jgi:hypothetical protein